MKTFFVCLFIWLVVYKRKRRTIKKLMSKLKRRKMVVEETKTEKQFRIKDENENLRILDAAVQRSTGGSPVSEGSSCWNSDVEKLWMKTLQCLCPQFKTLAVPPLPHLSKNEEKRCEQCWCSLDEDVAPFPNPADPYSLPHDTPFLSSPVSIPDLQDVGVCDLDVQRSVAGKSGSTLESSGTGFLFETVAETQENSKIKYQSGLGIESGSKPETDNEVGMSGRGSGSDGLRLEYCPICLTAFPVSFSQMECDGHLAQCLSQMNVDMTW